MKIAIPTLFSRLLLGVIFLMQGYGKVFTWGVSNVYNNGFKAYEETFLPGFLVKFTAYFTSYGELICGLLLILGLFRKVSYLWLAAILLIVSFGHGLQSPIWDLQHVFVRSVFLIFLMMIPLEKDSYALDHLIGGKKEK
ncbi:DoxX family membrane protein [Leptobacterium flavescens]|uniref:DoxX family membrane protein n=1 Tax=Leptobacterium flavescens TaxID=472055 RepID=A0A6P0UV49_9FLAO|nr:DoxX family membrane protein [Leptobacterium flavescens]NER14276.1 DoxX family membrane protein [Leptobacterium flavescens]